MSGFDENDPDESAIDEAALRFFARLRGDQVYPSDERAELEAWLAADPHHRERFEQLRQLWASLDELRSEPAILAMREEARMGLSHRSRKKSLAHALAASLAITVVLGSAWSAARLLRPHPQPTEQIATQDYATSIGQISRVRLPDGSLAILDTDSAIRTRIGSSGKRNVSVLRGRVMFEVAKKLGREFVVTAGSSVVTALGTKFDVSRTDNGLTVNLAEGRLRIEPEGASGSGVRRSRMLEMLAGDRAMVSGDRVELRRGVVHGGFDWVSGQLVFSDRPVAEVVHALNRYTTRRIIVVGPKVAAHRISAVIRVDDPMMLLQALEAMGIARVTETPNGFEIDGRAENLAGGLRKTAERHSMPIVKK